MSVETPNPRSPPLSSTPNARFRSALVVLMLTPLTVNGLLSPSFHQPYMAVLAITRHALVWKSPRFDAKGEKVANAVVVKAVLNGQVIHEDQELKTPTGSNWNKKESPTGPFMLQADHGPVAFRNVRIRPEKK